VTIEEGLVRDFPQVPGHQDQLADTLNTLGCVLSQLAKFEESEQVQCRSLEILEKLAAEYPKVPDYQSRIGDGLNNMAIILMDRGNWEDARQLLEQAIVHQKAAQEMNPQRQRYRDARGTHSSNLIAVQLALGDQAAAARTAATVAHDVNTGCYASRPYNAVANCEGKWNSGILDVKAEGTHGPDGRDAQRQAFISAANRLLIKAVIQDAVQQSLDDPEQYHIAYFLTTAPEPLRDTDLALQVARRAVELEPGDGVCMQVLGWALYRTGDYQGSIDALRKLKRHEAGFFTAMALWQLGEKTEARADFDRTSEWLKGYVQRCEEAALTQGE
jgi:Flp pilus assembly protein TadD